MSRLKAIRRRATILGLSETSEENVKFVNISWICQIATLCLCTQSASNSAKTFKPLPACEECSAVAPHLMAGAEGVVEALGVGGGALQQPIASAHPSLSTLHAVKLPREGQADFGNGNGSTGSRGTEIKGPHLHP